jgi:hypothetical protein
MDFIEMIDRALPGELCDRLIEQFEAHPEKRQGSTGSGIDPTKKLSLDITIDQFERFRETGQQVADSLLHYFAVYFLKYPFFGSINPVLKNNQTGEETIVTLENRSFVDLDMMKIIVGKYFRLAPLNILKYEAGRGSYSQWHAEVFPDATGEALHRVAFFVYYLNDVAVGGETEFFFQKLKVNPQKGRLIMAPAGFTHTHRGNRPESGDKYIITSWLLFKRSSVSGVSA